MSIKKHVTSSPTLGEQAFNKYEFVNAKVIYSGFERDIFAVVLKDGVMYSKTEAEALKDSFLKGEM